MRVTLMKEKLLKLEQENRKLRTQNKDKDDKLRVQQTKMKYILTRIESSDDKPLSSKYQDVIIKKRGKTKSRRKHCSIRKSKLMSTKVKVNAPKRNEPFIRQPIASRKPFLQKKVLGEIKSRLCTAVRTNKNLEKQNKTLTSMLDKLMLVQEKGLSMAPLHQRSLVKKIVHTFLHPNKKNETENKDRVCMKEVNNFFNKKRSLSSLRSECDVRKIKPEESFLNMVCAQESSRSKEIRTSERAQPLDKTIDFQRVLSMKLKVKYQTLKKKYKKMLYDFENTNLLLFKTRTKLQRVNDKNDNLGLNALEKETIPEEHLTYNRSTSIEAGTDLNANQKREEALKEKIIILEQKLERYNIQNTKLKGALKVCDDKLRATREKNFTVIRNLQNYAKTERLKRKKVHQAYDLIKKKYETLKVNFDALAVQTKQKSQETNHSSIVSVGREYNTLTLSISAIHLSGALVNAQLYFILVKFLGETRKYVRCEIPSKEIQFEFKNSNGSFSTIINTGLSIIFQFENLMIKSTISCAKVDYGNTILLSQNVTESNETCSLSYSIEMKLKCALNLQLSKLEINPKPVRVEKRANLLENEKYELEGLLASLSSSDMNMSQSTSGLTNSSYVEELKTHIDINN